jgi:hypothetical protein
MSLIYMGASRKFEHRLAGAQGDAGLQGTATITDTLGMRSCDCDRKDVGRPAIPLSRLPGEPRDCLPTAQFSNRTIYGAAEEIEQTPTTEHADARLQGIVPPSRTALAEQPILLRVFPSKKILHLLQSSEKARKPSCPAKAKAAARILASRGFQGLKSCLASPLSRNLGNTPSVATRAVRCTC